MKTLLILTVLSSPAGNPPETKTEWFAGPAACEESLAKAREAPGYVSGNCVELVAPIFPKVEAPNG